MTEAERGLKDIPERRRQAEKTPEPGLRVFLTWFVDDAGQHLEALAADSKD